VVSLNLAHPVYFKSIFSYPGNCIWWN